LGKPSGQFSQIPVRSRWSDDGTRCGSIDPGVILYLEQQKDMSPAEVQQLLYEQSGLLGVSGISGDMRELLASDRASAQEAVELFVYRSAGAPAQSLLVLRRVLSRRASRKAWFGMRRWLTVRRASFSPSS
jgi:hypothetical protein